MALTNVLVRQGGMVLGVLLLASTAHADPTVPVGAPLPGAGATPVPEPSTWLLLSAGLVGIAFASRATKKKKND